MNLGDMKGWKSLCRMLWIVGSVTFLLLQSSTAVKFHLFSAKTCSNKCYFAKGLNHAFMSTTSKVNKFGNTTAQVKTHKDIVAPLIEIQLLNIIANHYE